MGKKVEKEEKSLAPVKSEKNSLAPLITSLDRKINISFFLPAADLPAPNKPGTSPLANIADFLRRQGIFGSHLKPALLTFLVMNSAHLRNPISLEILDETSAGAKDLVSKCMTLIPESFWLSYSRNSLDTLIRKKDDLKGKVIIAMDSSGFKRDASILNSLLENQQLLEHRTAKSEFGDISKQIHVEGPISCVLVTDNPEEKILTYPGSLKFILNEDQQVQRLKFSQTTSRGTEISEIEFEISCGPVKQSLERIESLQVEIPFAGQMANFLFDSKVPCADKVMQSFLRMISIITLIHHRLPPTNGELLATLCKIDRNKIRRYMELKRGGDAASSVGSQRTVLRATKFEYFVFWLLMNETFQSGEDLLGDRELRIFDTIKRRNLGRITTEGFHNLSNDSEKLVAIGRAIECWSDIDQILEAVNKGGGKFITRSTLISDLDKLRKKGIIDRQKYQKKYVHAVTTLSVGAPIKLPAPKEIDEPVYGKKSIEVINPLTGVQETV